MLCEFCKKPLRNEYDNEYVQVAHHQNWAYPNGDCGNSVLHAAVYCSPGCVILDLSDREERLAIQTEPPIVDHSCGFQCDFITCDDELPF